LAKRVHHAAEEALADGHLQQLARAAHFVAFFNGGVIAQNDDADLAFLEAQRDAGHAVAEIEHLVQHGLAQAFDARDAVADFTDDADALPDTVDLRTGEALLDFLDERGHAAVSSAESRALMLSSYTSLPAAIRMPPIREGSTTNVV